MAKEKVVLWSPVEGHILDHGKPVEGLKLTQTIHWNLEPETPRIATTTTNKDGYFLFPQVNAVANLGFFAKLTHQPGMSTSIQLIYESQKVSIYGGFGTSYGDFEAPRAADSIKCDLVNIEPFGEGHIIKCETYKSKI